MCARKCQGIDLAPREALAEAFGARERSAQRWITDARNAGRLGSYDEEKAAAAWPSITKTGPITAADIPAMKIPRTTGRHGRTTNSEEN
jgi:hypothetical protein